MKEGDWVLVHYNRQPAIGQIVTLVSASMLVMVRFLDGITEVYPPEMLVVIDDERTIAQALAEHALGVWS